MPASVNPNAPQPNRNSDAELGSDFWVFAGVDRRDLVTVATAVATRSGPAARKLSQIRVPPGEYDLILRVEGAEALEEDKEDAAETS
ncbi:unnamed protein product, partial [Amoebophrya sp. A25]|eukprot:GSA25T00012218001.1